MSQIANNLTSMEMVQLEMMENEFNGCMSTETLPTRLASETLSNEAVANSTVTQKFVDYITSSSSSLPSSCSSSSSVSSEWSTTTASSSTVSSETASEEPPSTAVNSKSCCNTKELPSPITSKYAYDETTFLSSVLCNGNNNNSVVEITNTSRVSHNCNDQSVRCKNKNRNSSEMNSMNKTFLCSGIDNNANDNNIIGKESCVQRENFRDMREDHDELVDLSEDEQMENLITGKEKEIRYQTDDKRNIIDDDKEEDNTSWAERQSATLMRMRLHLLPQATAHDKSNSYTEITTEEKAAKQHVLFVNNVDDEEEPFLADKVMINNLTQESNVCDSSNDISPTHSSLYTTQPHVSNISGISPLKEEYASYISADHNNVNKSNIDNDIRCNNNENNTAKINRTKVDGECSIVLQQQNDNIYDNFNVVDVSTYNEDNTNDVDVPEIKKMISELLEELRTREKSVHRTDTSFHIPGSDKYWQERVTKRREQLQREVEKEKLHECTFHPSISPGSRAIATLREQNYSNMTSCNDITNNTIASINMDGNIKPMQNKNNQLIIENTVSDNNIINTNTVHNTSIQRKSVYDRLYQLAEKSRTDNSKIMHRQQNDSMNAWRKHCDGFVSSENYITNNRAQKNYDDGSNNNNDNNNNENNGRVRVKNTMESVMENTEMRLFLSNVLNCNIRESTSFDDLVRQEVAERTKCISPMSQAFAELKQSQAIDDAICMNSGNEKVNNNCDMNPHNNNNIRRRQDQFCEFWRRQQRHLARKARTVQVVKDELTPEFKPEITYKSNVIIQRLLLEDDKKNDTHPVTQPSSSEISECEQHLFAERSTESQLSRQNYSVTRKEQHQQQQQQENKEIMEKVKQIELHDELVYNQRNKKERNAIVLNTELVRQRKRDMCGVKSNESLCTFRPTISKGTKRLLSSSSRRKHDLLNHCELTNCTSDNAAKENVVGNIDMHRNDITYDKQHKESMDIITENKSDSATIDVSFVPDDATNNKQSKSNSSTKNINSSVHHSVNGQGSAQGNITLNEKKVNESTAKCKAHKRFEELYAQHQRVLRSREAARERKANEEVEHITFTPHINNYSCRYYSSSTGVRECKNKFDCNETCNADKEQVHQEELSDKMKKALELKEKEEHHITSLLSKEKRKHYVEIITKRQEEREEKLAAMLHEREKIELSECTFKPQLTRLPEYIPRMRSNGESARAVHQLPNYRELQRYKV